MKYIIIVLNAFQGLYTMALVLIDAVGLLTAVSAMTVVYASYRFFVVPLIGHALPSGSSDSVRRKKHNKKEV